MRRGKRRCFEKWIVIVEVVVVSVVARVGPVKKKSRALLIIELGFGTVAAQAVEIIAEALDS